MASIAGTYQLEKNENFVQYLKSLGIPEEQAKGVDSLKPKITVTVDGNSVSIASDSGVQNSSTTFVLGKEVDEKIALSNAVVKSTATLEGNKLTIKSKDSDGNTGTRVYNFTGSGVELTMTSGDGKTTAKRIYKKV